VRRQPRRGPRTRCLRPRSAGPIRGEPRPRGGTSPATDDPRRAWIPATGGPLRDRSPPTLGRCRDRRPRIRRLRRGRSPPTVGRCRGRSLPILGPGPGTARTLALAPALGGRRGPRTCRGNGGRAGRVTTIRRSRKVPSGALRQSLRPPQVLRTRRPGTGPMPGSRSRDCHEGSGRPPGAVQRVPRQSRSWLRPGSAIRLFRPPGCQAAVRSRPS